MQEAFVRAFRHARQLRGTDGRFGPWLFAIVRTVAADCRRQLRLPTLALDSPEAESFAVVGGVDEQFIEREERRAVLAALDALPEEYRVVLTLCDIEEVPHADAAPVLGRSTAATKSLLYRARRALRDRLAGRDETR